jgi:ligand-binding sensor domain-containing protein
MWIGTNQGLAKYSDDHLTVVFAKDSQDIPNVYVRALALDPNGHLLIGTFTGVSLFDGQKAVTLVDFLKDGYNDARLTTLASSADGEVWIGTDKGLLYGSPDMGWNMMTTANGLLSNYISALLVDQYGAVWVGAGGSNLDGGGLLQIVR